MLSRLSLTSLASACLALCLSAGGALAEYPGHPGTTPDINAADLAARDKAIADEAVYWTPKAGIHLGPSCRRMNRFPPSRE